jgi:predicted dehydrogenase
MARFGEMVRVGVVGAGHLGRIHAKLLANNTQCQLVAVADPSEASRALVANDLAVRTLDDYRSMADEVDGIIVAAPTFLHREIGSWFLERGIHVFMEKPIAPTAKDADQLVALAYENQCVLQVGHVERFNPVWVEASKFVDRDSIRYIEAAREGTYTGRSTDIGIVMDLMIHDIDLILSMVQSPVVSVETHGWAVLGSHEDFAVAHLTFKNGTIAQLRASRIAPQPKRTMQIYSDEGITNLDFATGTLTQTEPVSDVASGDRVADQLPAEERLKVKDQLFTNWLSRTEIKPVASNAIATEHSEFISAIEHGQPVTVNGHAGAAAVSIAQTILESIDRNSPSRSNVLPMRRVA